MKVFVLLILAKCMCFKFITSYWYVSLLHHGSVNILTSSIIKKIILVLLLKPIHIIEQDLTIVKIPN